MTKAFFSYNYNIIYFIIMFAFLKDAINELSHVVWPTKKESRIYMYYTVGIIVVMTVILSVIGIIFKEILQQGRQTINPSNTTNTHNNTVDNWEAFNIDNSNIDVKTNEDGNNIENETNKENNETKEEENKTEETNVTPTTDTENINQ